MKHRLINWRTELQYLVRNPGEYRVAGPVERLRITSLPLDPAAEDLNPERLRSICKPSQHRRARPAREAERKIEWAFAGM